MGRMFASVALLLLTSAAGAAPDKTAYELQERCGKESAAWFRSEYQTDTNMFYKFRNHYNARLNACIFVLYSTMVAKNLHIKSMHISNLNEHSPLGHHVEDARAHKTTSCEVQGVSCGSKAEFDRLVAPLLAD